MRLRWGRSARREVTTARRSSEMDAVMKGVLEAASKYRLRRLAVWETKSGKKRSKMFPASLSKITCLREAAFSRN